jgi:hypothetical protein
MQDPTVCVQDPKVCMQDPMVSRKIISLWAKKWKRNVKWSVSIDILKYYPQNGMDEPSKTKKVISHGK